MRESDASPNIGTYLADLLESIGVEHYFTVPGDYNLVLLDQLLKNDRLKMIGCCNELNAGYAADGYARVKGAAAVVVTFTVGGLSLVNAIAGAYAEDLPVIVISGGPNSNDKAQHHLLHHSTAEYDFDQVSRIFKEITAEAVVIRHIEDAHRLISLAFEAAILKRKPVYIEVACNLANVPIPQSVPLRIERRFESNPEALEAAVEAVANRLNQAAKPALVAGVRLRAAMATAAFHTLSNLSGYATAIAPNAKGMFPEDAPHFIGCYWGAASSPGCAEIMESCDAYLFAGPIFNDYTTAGWSCNLDRAKLIEVQPDRVVLAEAEYAQVNMQEFFITLSAKIQPNDAAFQAFKQTQSDAEPPEAFKEDVKVDMSLSNQAIHEQVQAMLNADSALLVETGDSRFNGQKLMLPPGCLYEFQMQYGSIGWSVGALLGYALALGDNKRAIALIGDGPFQLTAQAVSTMIRYGLNPIIFLINNGGYTIEVEIHEGPYNNIQNWDYAGLINIFNSSEGKGWGQRVTTVGELSEAIRKAESHSGLALIECVIDRDDCTQELLDLGSRVAAANSRHSIALAVGAAELAGNFKHHKALQ
ncbi:MAG: pyruvate decarboxylase [Phormidesmis priestleyi]|uniref:Alpha-keto-acid decarboxylase n=1 Tax=Phormidesmis priestleyi TaxID=268141 RepID=A0A2W4YXJ1_9CYAN|nr:MAG: pyruvate decarboxylase [Phormidesmis priestleyi]